MIQVEVIVSVTDETTAANARVETVATALDGTVATVIGAANVILGAAKTTGPVEEIISAETRLTDYLDKEILTPAPPPELIT